MKSYKKFLSYSYEPFRLHFCGPRDLASLKIIDDYLWGKKISNKKIENVAKEFVGVYPYLKLIAKKNGLEPLDKQVIEAYWLGNSLLKQVTVDDLKTLVLKNFIGQGRLSQAEAEESAENIPARATAHHSFHVLYIGSVTNTVQLVGKMLDLCRISWGKIIKIPNSIKLGSTKSQIPNLLIKYRPLILKQNEIRLSRDEEEKEIKWNQKILPKITEGQIVSFHWDLACEVLSEDQVRNLEKYTIRNVEAVNNLENRN